MHSTIGIDVAAAPELVYRLAHDVTRWERLLPHYSRSAMIRAEAGNVLVCEFIARRPFVPVLGLGIPVAWRSRTWSESDTRRLRFVHVAGATRGMDVTWTIEPLALEDGSSGTRIEIAHDFEPRIPGFATFVDVVFTRPIAGRTLATIGALAEALTTGSAGESGSQQGLDT